MCYTEPIATPRWTDTGEGASGRCGALAAGRDEGPVHRRGLEADNNEGEPMVDGIPASRRKLPQTALEAPMTAFAVRDGVESLVQ